MPDQHQLTAFRAEYRVALYRLIRRLKPNFFLTLNFNMDISLSNGKRRLRSFLAVLDRKMLGPKWISFPSSRSDFIFFPEHVLSNLHFHGLGTLPYGFSPWHLEYLDKSVATSWKKVVPSGTAHLRRFNKSDLQVVSRYSSKEWWNPNEDHSFVLSREFWSTRGPRRK